MSRDQIFRQSLITIALGLAPALFPLGVAAAQESGDRSVLRARLEQLEARSRIRVQTPEGDRVIGTLTQIAGDSVRLATGEGDRTIPLPRIDAFWTRGRAILPGALIGGAVGLGVGVFYGLVIAALEETTDKDYAGRAAVVGLLGGLGGAVVGGVIGAAIPTWKQRFP